MHGKAFSASYTQNGKRLTVCVKGELKEPTGGALTPQRPLLTRKPGGRKVPLHISAKRFEIDEDVKRAHLRTHWLAVK